MTFWLTHEIVQLSAGTYSHVLFLQIFMCALCYYYYYVKTSDLHCTDCCIDHFLCRPPNSNFLCHLLTSLCLLCCPQKITATHRGSSHDWPVIFYSSLLTWCMMTSLCLLRWAIHWGTKWRRRWFMVISLKLPDCQTKLASSEQSYMLFHLHSLSFAVVKRRISLFFRTPCQAWKL